MLSCLIKYIKCFTGKIKNQTYYVAPEKEVKAYDFDKIEPIYNKNQSTEKQAQNNRYSNVNSIINQNLPLKNLWYNGSEKEWNDALNYYYYMLRPEQRGIEEYIENVDVEWVGNLDAIGFYNFLYEKYFVWKYTAKNRLATTRKNLEKYIKNDELSKLKNIQTRLFCTSKNDIGKCLEIANEIYGLGTAGASGLLAILFPEHFGTVDQFVVKRLQEINHPTYSVALSNMNPEGLKIKDGVILIKIMRTKADELNKKFNTNFWTPRKIDMILWSYGR